MNLPNGALVALVDGEKLVLLKNTGEQEIKLSPVPKPSIPAVASGTTGHRSSAANPDNVTQGEDDFIAGVANLLNKQVLDGTIHDLVVIAAPRALGELRKHWHKALEARLAGEIAKDMTGQSIEQIASMIAAA